MIVDCVGLTEEEKAWVDTRPLERASAKEAVVSRAVEPLMKAEMRQRILSLREQSAQLIDMTRPDRVTFAGWTDAGQARDDAVSGVLEAGCGPEGLAVLELPDDLDVAPVRQLLRLGRALCQGPWTAPSEPESLPPAHRP